MSLQGKLIPILNACLPTFRIYGDFELSCAANENCRRFRGLRLSRTFSLAYSAGPELAGNAGAFRRFLFVSVS